MGTETGDRLGAAQQSSVRFTPQSPDLPPLAAATLRALTTLLGFLGVSGGPLPDFAQAALRWEKISDRKKAADALRLGDLRCLSDIVKHACKLGGQIIGSDDLIAKRNAALAMLRVHFWMDLIRSRTPGLPETGMALPAIDQEEATNRRLRAMELMLRAAINESYVDREALIERLRDLRPKEVEKWLRAADGRDILSGVEFQPLIELFVFPEHHARLYKGTPFLELFPEKRITLRHFLEDARELRNRLAHHKPITPNQSALLAMYFEEVIEPLAQAHVMGLLKTDPRGLENNGNGMPAWLDQLHARAAKSEMDSAFLRETAGRIKQDTTAILKRAGLVVALSVLIAAGVGATLLMTGGISIGVSNLQVAVKSVKQEVSSDPRKELMNQGTAWGPESLLKAMEVGDIRTVTLFLDGEMDPSTPYSGCNVLWYAIARNMAKAAEQIDLLAKRGYNFNAVVPCQPSASSDLTAAPLTTAILYRNGPVTEALLSHGAYVTSEMIAIFTQPPVLRTEFAETYGPKLLDYLNKQGAGLAPADALRQRGLPTTPEGVVQAIQLGDVSALRLFETLHTPFDQPATFLALAGAEQSSWFPDLLTILRRMGFDFAARGKTEDYQNAEPQSLLKHAIRLRSELATRALLDAGAPVTQAELDGLDMPYKLSMFSNKENEPGFPGRWRAELIKRRIAEVKPAAVSSPAPTFDMSPRVPASSVSFGAAESIPVPGLAPSKVQARAIAFVEIYFAQWSASNEQALASMARSYAARVDYFGRVTARSAVLTDKRNFALRWPIRSYTLRPGSVVAICEESGTVCTVSSVVEWDCRSPERKARSAGVVDFMIKVSWGNNDTEIVAENGTVVRRAPSQ